MPFEQVLYEVQDGVATITLNRPEKLNAWTFKMEREWREALSDADARDDVRVIVLTGAGRGFCAGADLSLLTEIQGGAMNLDDVPALDVAPSARDGVRDDFRKPYTFPPSLRKPVIGAINGPAFGLGLVHALFCDIRISSDKATFGTAFVHRGLIAEHGIAWLLPRLVGIENALDLLLSGRTIDAQEALRIGLVSRVVPHDRFAECVRKYTDALATKCSPRSMSVMKKQVWDSLMTELGPATDIAIKEMLESFASDDFREGVMSYIEKRPPQFSGR